jgi:hypothetical protein
MGCSFALHLTLPGATVQRRVPGWDKPWYGGVHSS